MVKHDLRGAEHLGGTVRMAASRAVRALRFFDGVWPSRIEHRTRRWNPSHDSRERDTRDSG